MDGLAASLIQFFGRLHPLVLHLPIGLLAGLTAIEVVALLRRKPAPRDVTKLLVWLVAASAVVTAATGYTLGREGTDTGPTLALHRQLGIALAILCVLMAVAHTALRTRIPYALLLVATLGLLGPTAHLGGSMTHGAKFLTEPFAHLFATHGESPDASAGDASDAGGGVYATQVAPIFAERCTGCHGESRQKAKLALNTPEGILKGSMAGPVIVPGKPDESELIRRIRLPLDDDDHMPPSEKPQLTAEQIRTLEEWVAAGAPFEGDGAETRPGEAGAAGPADARDGVPPVDPAALAALREHLVHVEPAAEGSNLLFVDFAAAAGSTDDASARELLEPVLLNLDTLGLSRCAVGDDTATLLARGRHLRRLDLRGTRITDAGLAALAALPELRELVLVQTTLTDACVEHLAAIPALQRVFLWDSGVSDEAVGRLRERRPELHVDAGDAAKARAEQTEPDIEFTSDAPIPGEPAKAVSLTPVNTTCPVSGQPVDPKYVIVFGGRVIGFCCPKCPGQFWAAPAKFEAKLPPPKSASPASG